MQNEDVELIKTDLNECGELQIKNETNQSKEGYVSKTYCNVVQRSVFGSYIEYYQKEFRG